MSLKTYRPSKFVVGYTDITLENSQKAKLGYPSCKWLKEGKWTETSRFSRITGGYAPHQQRDAEKQLKKDLGMKIEEFNNEPLEGFQILKVHHGYASNDHFVTVKDPRGFCLNLESDFIEKVILKYHLGISGNGVIEGKWFYLWKAEHFVGIRPEVDFNNVDVDDQQLEVQHKKLKNYKIEDLVVGKVYDLADASGDKNEIRRVVYLGQKILPNIPTIRNFFNYGFNINELGRQWNRIRSGGLNETNVNELDFLPWNNSSAVKKAENAMKPWNLTPVFILLEDAFSSYVHYKSEYDYNEYYCDDLAELPQEEKECSILFNPISYGDSNSLLTGKDIVKRLVNESSDQRLRIIAKRLPYGRNGSSTLEQFKYTSPNDYKVMKLETLNVGVDRYIQKLKKEIDNRLELASPKVPTDLKKWFDKVFLWYQKVYEPKQKSYYRHW